MVLGSVFFCRAWRGDGWYLPTVALCSVKNLFQKFDRNSCVQCSFFLTWDRASVLMCPSYVVSACVLRVYMGILRKKRDAAFLLIRWRVLVPSVHCWVLRYVLCCTSQTYMHCSTWYFVCNTIILRIVLNRRIAMHIYRAPFTWTPFEWTNFPHGKHRDWSLTRIRFHFFVFVPDRMWYGCARCITIRVNTAGPRGEN